MRDEQRVTEKRTSVDRGWAWLVALAIALWNMIIAGTIKSSGVLYVEFLALFDGNPSAASWISASLCLTLFLFAPLSGLLKDMSSHSSSRLIIVVGTFIAAGGIFASAWTQSTFQAIIIFGLVVGVASAAIDAPILSSVGIYFIRRRFLANAIAFSGSSVGGFVLPPVLLWAVKVYGIRGALVILAGIWLHILVVASILRPLSRKDRHFTQMELSLAVEIKECQSISTGAEKSEQVKGPDDVALSFQNHDELNQVTPSLSVTPNQRTDQKGFLFIIKDYWEFLCSPGLPELIVTFVISSIAYYTQFFLLPPVIVEADLHKSLVSQVLSTCSIVELFSRILVGLTIDRYPDMKSVILLLSFIVSAMSGFVLSFMPSKSMLLTHAVVIGALGGLFVSLIIPMLLEHVPGNKMGSAVGLFPFISGLGATVGPPIVSMLKERTGVYCPSGMLFLSSCYLVAFVLLGINLFHKKICVRTRQ